MTFRYRMKELTTGHVVLLWLGLFCDALATRMMAMSVEETTWDLHTISGYGGLALMVILAVSGAWAIKNDNRDVLTSFHKFAMPIGLFWMVSFITGVWIGINRV